MILKGVDETEKDPVKEQDSKNEDDEFKRIEQEQEQRKKTTEPNPAIWP
jgi:hypothetical protein